MSSGQSPEPGCSGAQAELPSGRDREGKEDPALPAKLPKRPLGKADSLDSRGPKFKETGHVGEGTGAGELPRGAEHPGVLRFPEDLRRGGQSTPGSIQTSSREGTACGDPAWCSARCVAGGKPPGERVLRALDQDV